MKNKLTLHYSLLHFFYQMVSSKNGTTAQIGTIVGSVLGGVLLDYTSVNMMLIAAVVISMLGIIFVYKGISKI